MSTPSELFDRISPNVIDAAYLVGYMGGALVTIATDNPRSHAGKYAARVLADLAGEADRIRAGEKPERLPEWAVRSGRAR